MKLGAYDYVTKPLYPDEILLTIKQALIAASETAGMATEVVDEKVEMRQSATTARAKDVEAGFLVGNSPKYTTVIEQVHLVAPTNFSVIIYGESGSGKEVIAKQIHLNSTRADKPFIAIDCGALSKELSGSELFGHERGAFTGAVGQKIGSLELANGGTVFLDEIGNLPYDIQVSLLRVVQERKIKRVGGTKDIEIDVRIIIASNERLWGLAKAGKFREDLYHRFNEFSIEVPALRERKEDIVQFSRYFLQRTNAELGKNVEGFAADVEEALENYPWYGNLRELKNVVKRATLLTSGAVVELRSLPFEITNFQSLRFDTGDDTAATEPAKDVSLQQVPFYNRLKVANLDAEYEVILEALKKSGYNKSKAAKLLDIDRKTLYNKMKQYKDLNL
jgi:two-component system response regulator HydG